MPANQVAHGVIQINVQKKFTPDVAKTVPTGTAQSHPITATEPPAPVVQHKTAAEIEAEAAQLAIDVAAANAKTSS